MEVEFDVQKFIDKMSGFSSTDEDMGVTRLPFSQAQILAEKYIVEVMTALELEVYSDAVGTIVGVLPGESDSVIMSGSHYDSVPCGGKYDGVAGIAAALKCVDLIKNSGDKPYYGIAVIAFNDEEGVRFNNGFLSSKTFCGYYEKEDFEKIVDDKGKSVAELIGEYKNLIIMDTFKYKIESFVEIHIEQGTKLYKNRISLGIVEHIVGVWHFLFKFEGDENHAGTTSMDDRTDPVPFGCRFVSELPKIAKKYKDSVITVGKITLNPGAVNVIPSSMECTVDLRLGNKEQAEKMINEIKKLAKMIVGENRKIRVTCSNFLSAPIVAMNPEVVEGLKNAVEKEGIPYIKLDSGAGHDTQIIAAKLKTGMIFIPSVKGKSHSKEEFTKTEDIITASKVLKGYVADAYKF